MNEVVKIYNVIGSGFKGVWVFKYNLNGVLAAFELQDVIMNDKQVLWLFSRHFPYKESHINNYRAYANFTVTEGDFDLTFTMFWDAYNHKIKREMSLKAWDKLTDDDKMRAIAGIRHYDGYLARKRNMEKAHASTYINQKYWNDNWGSAN